MSPNLFGKLTMKEKMLQGFKITTVRTNRVVQKTTV